MVNKYKKFKKSRRVSFHLGACSILFLIFAIISKELYLIILLSLIFVLCLVIYILSRNKMEKIESLFTTKCINCNKDTKIESEFKYLLYGQNVSKHDFETNIADDKKKYEINKYICLDCHLCFTILKIYQLDSKGEFILMKTEKNLDEEYSGNY